MSARLSSIEPILGPREAATGIRALRVLGRCPMPDYSPDAKLNLAAYFAVLSRTRVMSLFTQHPIRTREGIATATRAPGSRDALSRSLATCRNLMTSQTTKTMKATITATEKMSLRIPQPHRPSTRARASASSGPMNNAAATKIATKTAMMAKTNFWFSGFCIGLGIPWRNQPATSSGVAPHLPTSSLLRSHPCRRTQRSRNSPR